MHTASLCPEWGVEAEEGYLIGAGAAIVRAVSYGRSADQQQCDRHFPGLLPHWTLPDREEQGDERYASNTRKLLITDSTCPRYYTPFNATPLCYEYYPTSCFWWLQSY